MLESDTYIAGISKAVLELLRFKIRSGNHQRGIPLIQKFSETFGNMREKPSDSHVMKIMYNIGCHDNIISSSIETINCS